LPLDERGTIRVASKPLGLRDRQAYAKRALLDGARAQRASAARGPIGLRQDADERVRRGSQRVERGHCEFRRAGECDAQHAGMEG
jgi:hypothetical protein